MKKSIIPILTFYSLILLATNAAAVNSGRELEQKYVPGEFLIMYKPGVQKSAIKNFQTRWGASTIRMFEKLGIEHVSDTYTFILYPFLILRENDHFFLTPGSQF